MKRTWVECQTLSVQQKKNLFQVLLFLQSLVWQNKKEEKIRYPSRKTGSLDQTVLLRLHRILITMK